MVAISDWRSLLARDRMSPPCRLDTRVVAASEGLPEKLNSLSLMPALILLVTQLSLRSM